MQLTQFLTATAISLLACMPLTSATNFLVTGNFGVTVQDNTGVNHNVGAKQTVTINGGWAFVWANSASGGDTLECDGYAFSWPSNYGDVYWVYNVSKQTGYIVDSKGNQIGGTQKCVVS